MHVHNNPSSLKTRAKSSFSRAAADDGVVVVDEEEEGMEGADAEREEDGAFS